VVISVLQVINLIVVDRLHEELYLIYSEELLNLNIGYNINKDNLKKMMDIVSQIVTLKLNY
jgi:hypothetical protein